METKAGIAMSSWEHLELEQLFSKALPEILTFPSHMTFWFDRQRPSIKQLTPEKALS